MYGRSYNELLGHTVYQNKIDDIIGAFANRKDRDAFFKLKLCENVCCDKSSGETVETDNNLKPCPFHKDKRDVADLDVVKDICHKTDRYYVRCSYCLAIGSYSSTIEGAKKNWNKRV